MGSMMDRSIEIERIQRDTDWYDELLAYRDIGTLEEMQRIVEREKPIRAKVNEFAHRFDEDGYTCSACMNDFEGKPNYCEYCGQRFSWEDD